MTTVAIQPPGVAAQLVNTTGRGERVAWPDVQRDLDRYGCAVVPKTLTPVECRALSAMYEDPGIFRSKVIKGRHGFGQGEYQYFKYPLPAVIAELRSAFSFIAGHGVHRRGVRAHGTAAAHAISP